MDHFFEKCTKKFDSQDIDLIDKAERYMAEALTGAKAKKEERYQTPQSITKLIKFVEWAKKRGGDDAFNELKRKGENQMTEEEKEMSKPFWTRTYFVGKQEFRFDRKWVNDFMKRPDIYVKDNESAYFDYKKRALFPKATETKKAYMKPGEERKELGFIEE